MTISYENKLKYLLLDLSFSQRRLFGIFCISRIIGLYENIDDFIDINEMNKNLKKGDASILMKSIYNKLINNDTYVVTELMEMRELCDFLVIDTDDTYDSTTENVVFKIVAECVYTFLSFLINKKFNDILNCSVLVIDVINAQTSDVLFSLLRDEDKYDSEIEYLFESEYTIQIQAINFIFNNKIDEINNLIKKTTIPKQPKCTINLLNKYHQ